MVGATDDIVTNGILKTMKAEYASYCPKTCTTRTIEIPPSDWGTKVDPEVSAALDANPSLNVVDVLFDAMVPGAVAAVRTLGKANIPVVSFNGSTSASTYMEAHTIVGMDVGESVNWIAYAQLDQAFRLLLHVHPGNEVTPIRMWDQANVKATGTPPSLLKGYGMAYANDYLKLWGLSH
jgi:ribose transport system substrate-binding protein